jgi:hypothetical protein
MPRPVKKWDFKEPTSAPELFDKVARAFLECRWVFAKTMPENPHHYTVRKHWDEAALGISFDDQVTFIREHGYREKYGKYWYTLLNVNGFKYWTMGAPLAITILINRKPIAGAHDSVEQPYDRIAERYDQLWSDEASRAEDRRVMELIGYKGGAVLDIGCGSGLFLDHVKPDEYLGIDPSLKMLDQLRAKHPDAVALCTRFEEYAPMGRRFDLIVGLFGAPSYVTPAHLRRIPPMLTEGGRFFLMFYDENYDPTTHAHIGFSPDVFDYAESNLSGTAAAFGNFIIVENDY